MEAEYTILRRWGCAWDVTREIDEKAVRWIGDGLEIERRVSLFVGAYLLRCKRTMGARVDTTIHTHTVPTFSSLRFKMRLIYALDRTSISFSRSDLHESKREKGGWQVTQASKKRDGSTHGVPADLTTSHPVFHTALVYLHLFLVPSS